MDFLNDFANDTEFIKLLGRRDDQVNLTAAALELARDAYPKLDFQPVFDWIGQRASELQGPLARAGSDEQILAELAECIAGRQEITGSAESYELADGSPVELEYGFARISLMGQETVSPIIFGPEGSEPILGVLALEGLGISVDPKTRSLHRVHAKSLK